MILTQDFTKDLDIMLEAIADDEKFCFIRFGDGESAILRGRERPFVSNKHGSTWDSRNLSEDYVAALRNALEANLDGLYIGTICPSCSGQSSKPLRDHVMCPLERQTYAELFANANYHRLNDDGLELVRPFIFLVGSMDGADLQIPTNLPERSIAEHDEIVAKLCEVRDQPIALAAGPSACVLGHRYWLAQRPERRETCLDVGAVFDPLYWRKTRHYMPEGAPRGRRVCTWDGSGVGLDTD